jgi:FAD/FMN-containing dehydrogenase
MSSATQRLTAALAAIVGDTHVTADKDVLAARTVDYTGRYRGNASILARPGTADEVAQSLRACRDMGACVTVQGGRTSLVAGTVPEHHDVLLSTERLTDIGEVDSAEQRVWVGAGVTLAALQRVAADAGLLFGVDIASRDSATLGGMASTNAGGLRTIRYGDMGAQVLGIEFVLPDGSTFRRNSPVRSDNTGYDLAALFVGAEGTLGVITGLDLRLRPIPVHRITAIAGFPELAAAVDASRRLRALEDIAALELIDGRAATLAAQHLNVVSPLAADWLLLVELAGQTDPADRLAGALDDLDLAGEAAVGIDQAAQQRLWRIRESVADVVNLFGPPLKFDISLPISAIATFANDAIDLVERHAAEAIPLIFGHLGEGNLHLNLLNCTVDREPTLAEQMMNLIAAHRGNVSSEHGVGTRKRQYLAMSRRPADISCMKAIKSALDPIGYLNPAVMFD